ncbi:putative sugar O-methyltransferase [Nocardiopsis sp. Huas11]|uniref:putative sugar O-methyltransferase n=1 Tax=Nocardiopsis sp. Huas11 TaxID=2183912 RepID=UPI000EAF18B0|nr:putative sugar O-methyltransferase [Nocardiopsis sp. Huas11]RKS06886.1 putative sugar O-methyltransferase [Nocardiopsis sp. Huas11]
MDEEYGSSALWEHYNATRLTDDSDLTGFKSSDINFKLALWDPRTNGVRYVKTLIHTLCSGLGPENWERLTRIARRDVGSPITVTYDGEDVCLDYLMAVRELEFIAAHTRLDGATVVEIGAGYGRTCHAILSNHDVAAYHVVDLSPSLRLCRDYLGAVLDESTLDRVHFHGVDEAASLFRETSFDLCLNIDSFAEMDEDIVRAYLALVDTGCTGFYVNNPVGKYMDPSLDGHAQGQELVSLALSTGILRDIVDIHDNRAVAARGPVFVDAYRPGEQWTCVADDRNSLWPYYWQALYQRGAPGAAPGA